MSNISVKGRSLWVDSFKTFRKDKIAIISLIVFLLIVLVTFITPLFFDGNYYAQIDLLNTNQPPSYQHWFGTDQLGRDVMIRSLVGGQTSLEIALVATLVSVIIGTLYGSIAGFVGGKVDSVMMRVVDALYALPFLFFAILLVTLFGRNFILVFIAIGVVSWLDMARVVRGQTIAIKNKEFIEAAKVAGVSDIVVVKRHIIRNLIGIVAVYITLTIPTVLMISAFLGFLGLGVQPPMTGWGEMISDGSQFITMGYWWMLVFPAIFLTVTLLALNFIGNAMRNALDPRNKR